MLYSITLLLFSAVFIRGAIKDRKAKFKCVLQTCLGLLVLLASLYRFFTSSHIVTFPQFAIGDWVWELVAVSDWGFVQYATLSAGAISAFALVKAYFALRKGDWN